MKNILLIIIVVLIAGAFIGWTEKRDAQLMSINYCWDSNGEHYIAPNEACR